MDQSAILAGLLTTAVTIFVVELTDKDALFLLALATKTKALVVFVAGSLAFTITTAIIVAVGSVLIALVPVFAIKIVGGAIMLGYASLEYYRLNREARDVERREQKLLGAGGVGPWSVFVPALLTLIVLDLAGDATELVTVVFLARFRDAIVVFAGAVLGLVAAVAVETALGKALGRLLSERRIRYLSIGIFAVIGTTIIVTTLLGS